MLPASDVAQYRLDGFLVADQVVVDNKDDPKPSASECLKLGQGSLVFRRGLRPKVTMMSQYSQVKGQPREICMLPNM